VYVEQETAVTTLRRRQRIEKATNTPTDVFAIGSQRGAEFVGSADIPKDGSLWVLPRAKSDVPLLRLFTKKKHTFESYGYETGIGLFVPHRDKRRTLARKGRNQRAFPLVWSTDISRSGELRFEKNSHKKRFVVIPEADDEVVIRVPSVALQRTTAKDDARRLVAVPIAERFVSKYGGYIGENHVVFLLKTDHAVCEIGVLAEILHSHIVDRLFRCMSGSVAVSTSELAELPLPDPRLLNAALARGENVELAIATGYREPVEAGRGHAVRQLSAEEALA
jgi:adenine-specific DNA-methyltransferase